MIKTLAFLLINVLPILQAASQDISAYFQKPCGGQYVYSLSLNQEYIIQNTNLSICSNISLSPSVPNTLISLKIISSFFIITQNGTIQFKFCSFSFEYTLPSGSHFTVFSIIQTSNFFMQVDFSEIKIFNFFYLGLHCKSRLWCK